jgi:hypothetical protein
MHDWTGIHSILLHCLVLCQCVSVRLWTLPDGMNAMPACDCPLIKTIKGLSLHLQSITVLRQGETHLNRTSSSSALDVQSRCILPVRRRESARAATPPPGPRCSLHGRLNIFQTRLQHGDQERNSSPYREYSPLCILTTTGTNL